MAQHPSVIQLPPLLRAPSLPKGYKRCLLALFLQLFREKLCARQSRKVTYMGYVQYTVPDTVAVELTFVAFL